MYGRNEKVGWWAAELRSCGAAELRSHSFSIWSPALLDTQSCRFIERGANDSANARKFVESGANDSANFLALGESEMGD